MSKNLSVKSRILQLDNNLLATLTASVLDLDGLRHSLKAFPRDLDLDRLDTSFLEQLLQRSNEARDFIRDALCSLAALAYFPEPNAIGFDGSWDVDW
jgi:hypothetical protein